MRCTQHAKRARRGREFFRELAASAFRLPARRIDKFLNLVPADDHARVAVCGRVLAYTGGLECGRTITVELLQPRQRFGIVGLGGLRDVACGFILGVAVGEIGVGFFDVACDGADIEIAVRGLRIFVNAQNTLMRIQIDQHAVEARHEAIIQHHIARPGTQPVLRDEALQRRQIALGKIGHQQHHHILALRCHRKIDVGFIRMHFLLGDVMRFGDHVQAMQCVQRHFAGLCTAGTPAHLVDVTVQGDGDGQRQQAGFFFRRLCPFIGTERIAAEANTQRLPNVCHLNTQRQCIGPPCIKPPQLQTRLVIAQQPVEVIFELQNQS